MMVAIAEQPKTKNKKGWYKIMKTTINTTKVGISRREGNTVIVEIDVKFSQHNELQNECSLKLIAEKVANYYRKNKAQNVRINNCWTSGQEVYNGKLDESYYAGWIEIRFEKEIKTRTLTRQLNALEKLTDEVIKGEEESLNRYLELNEFYSDLKKKDTQFNPENTAIDTRNSKSAEMVADAVTEDTKVLDYGCGTGRNIKYIKNNSDAIVDGTDIPEQLEKEKVKHDKIRDARTVIAPTKNLPNDYYNIVLNSHVLNVIEDDNIKKVVVKDMFEKLVDGGQAIIEVRTKSDVEGAKTKEKYGDGWKIKKGSSYTYQEGITKDKMVNLVTSVGFKIQEHIYNSTRHIVRVAK